MAVIKAKPQKFMPYLFGIVKYNLVIPQMIKRVPGDSFKGALDDTVTMNIPGLYTTARDYEWRTRTAPIVLDDIQGGGKVDIKLDKHVYTATSITDEQATMDDLDWVREVMTPQAVAVAESLELKAVAGFNAINYKWSIPYAAATDPILIFQEALRLWGQPEAAMLPTERKFFLCGVNVAAAMFIHDRFTRYDWSGPQATALDQATRGSLLGITIVVSERVDPNFAVFMTESALVMGNIAPVAPKGATQSSQLTQDGLSLRWLMDYDPNYLRDRSIVSTFVGLSTVYDERKGGTGTDRYELKQYAQGENPATVRAIKVNFTPAKAGGSVLP